MFFKVLVTDGPGTDILVPVTSKSLQYSPEGFADSLVWVPAGTANISVAQILKFFLKQKPILGAQVPHQLLASSFPEQKKQPYLSPWTPAVLPSSKCQRHRFHVFKSYTAQRLMRHLIHISWLLFALLCLWETQWKSAINRIISDTSDN